jgi:hypothetical protein
MVMAACFSLMTGGYGSVSGGFSNAALALVLVLVMVMVMVMVLVAA